VKRAVLADAARSEAVVEVVVHNNDEVRELVTERVATTQGRITAKRLLPVAVAAGYSGSDRNFRRLVAEEKKRWRQSNHRGRRPGVWSPGDALVIDWGEIGSLSVFCAVLAWSRWRFVYFADNQRADTTIAALAACFEALGGVPASVRSDRMGCLKAATVAGLVVPTADYVRFATHYRFRPDFCEGYDPESKVLVENLVGYVKSDRVIPADLTAADLPAANAAGVVWGSEVNATVHSEICAVPDERLAVERDLLQPLPCYSERFTGSGARGSGAIRDVAATEVGNWAVVPCASPGGPAARPVRDAHRDRDVAGQGRCRRDHPVGDAAGGCAGTVHAR
jgi:transposase